MIPLPLKPKVIEKKQNKAVFMIECLYPGYGVTVGNAMRRVLISSLEGAAVTQLRIKGVRHEFSTLHGVLEDVITIMLNLKQLRFKMYSDEPQKGRLLVKGETKVKANDFELPTQVELINKESHIATLTDKKAELDMEIQIEKGIGYQPASQRRKEKLEIGTIALDTIFTPVRRVSFRIENMRVGERTDYDRLFLEIETDGTVTPEEAFFRASGILVQHFSLLSETFKQAPAEATKEGERPKEDLTKIKLDDLKLSAKTINVLLKNNVKTVGGIVRKSEKTLLALAGLGERGVEEIKKALKKLGLELK